MGCVVKISCLFDTIDSTTSSSNEYRFGRSRETFTRKSERYWDSEFVISHIIDLLNFGGRPLRSCCTSRSLIIYWGVRRRVSSVTKRRRSHGMVTDHRFF